MFQEAWVLGLNRLEQALLLVEIESQRAWLALRVKLSVLIYLVQRSFFHKVHLVMVLGIGFRKLRFVLAQVFKLNFGRRLHRKLFSIKLNLIIGFLVIDNRDPLRLPAR